MIDSGLIVLDMTNDDYFTMRGRKFFALYLIIFEFIEFLFYSFYLLENNVGI